jgi:hypothetical protein
MLKLGMAFLFLAKERRLSTSSVWGSVGGRGEHDLGACPDSLSAKERKTRRERQGKKATREKLFYFSSLAVSLGMIGHQIMN